MKQARINSAALALSAQHGSEYALGFLVSQLAIALEHMPKTKQAAFAEQFEHAVGNVVTVRVKNLMNPAGPDVELPWNLVGTVCDPSTERYWSM